MKKQLLFLLLFFIILSVLISPRSITAQTSSPDIQPDLEATAEATLSAEVATPSAEVEEASPSAKVEEKIQEKTQKDITETTGEVKSKLAQYLDENPLEPLNPFNFVQHAIRRAVDAGVPANMLVLLLLFPIVASFIAISRHILGLRGFGVYTPAVLSVAFLSTGIATGLILFGVILVAAIVGRSIIERFKLQYLPRSALMIWFMSLVVFIVLLFSPYIMTDLVTVGIFPILVLLLLTEDFTSAQFSGSIRGALQLTLETLVLATISALFIGLELVQQFVILHPEIIILVVAVSDLIVGKYTGLRIAEFFRFGLMLDSQEE